eukprot:1684317-Rhodomonas_salina.1
MVASVRQHGVSCNSQKKSNPLYPVLCVVLTWFVATDSRRWRRCRVSGACTACDEALQSLPQLMRAGMFDTTIRAMQRFSRCYVAALFALIAQSVPTAPDQIDP